MATNPYFVSNYSAYTAEQDLIHSLTIESTQIFGIDLKYLPRTLMNFDSFYGEDTHSSFDQAITLEFYIKNYEGFNGAQMLSKFGLQISEELIITCARKRFEQTVTAIDPTISRPREGDLIYVPYAVDERQRVFEITYVNQTENFSTLGERYSWEISCRVFKFNGEKFETGDTEIDGFDLNYLATEIQLAAGAGAFSMGDTVTQTNGFTGEVISFNTLNNVLTITNTKGEMSTTLPLTNGSVSRNISGVVNEVANDSGLNDNNYLKTKEQVLVDFSEDNPFSEM